MEASDSEAHSGPLGDVERLPLLAAETVTSFGRTLVVAPHQDDESLGCGGTIALLCARRLPVHVLFVSDGAGSHPNSRTYPMARLIEVREREARAALAALGGNDDATTFLRLPDRYVPRAGSEGFTAACAMVRGVLDHWQPDTILLPWRRDPHGDHRASWELVTAVATPAVRLIEYPIWILIERGAEDLPRAGEVRGWRLDIGEALVRKRAAIAAHRSQTTDLIGDDPAGFRLTASDLGHFDRSFELFLEPCG